MNPDAYNFRAYCKECQQERSVASSRAQIQSGNPVSVYAIACDHSWTLSPEETKKLREHITTAA
jgi:hypothetical protein